MIYITLFNNRYKVIFMLFNNPGFSNDTTFTRFNLAKAEENVILQPGLFKGNYGSHGIELINFTYNANKTVLQGRKVTVSSFLF